MDAVVKDKWLAALRSGEFSQSTGVLAAADTDGNIEGYCCLGVLCEVAVREGVISKHRFGNIYDQVPTDEEFNHNREELTRVVYGDFETPVSYQSRSSTELPNIVREWAGLDQAIPEVWLARDPEDIEFDKQDGILEPDTAHKVGVAELNDEGYSFDFIADKIERHL